MDESKAVARPGEAPEPNTFFFQSPFRSWRFLFNSALLVADCICCAIVFSKMPGVLHFWLLLCGLLWFAVYPYWWAIIRHRRINELFRSSKIVAQPAQSPQNVLLKVADDATNEGLCTTSFAYLGILILLLKIH
jgi:hypothetical protein